MFALYKKELQSYFYSPFAYVVCALFLMIFSLSLVNGISNLDSSIYTFSFSDVFYNNFFYFIFLIPVLTMKTFAEERKLGTETLIMSSPISIPKIVLAKFFAVSTVFLLMTVLSFIYPLITAILGQVQISSLICSYIGFFAMGLVCITVGMLMSSFTDSTVIAAILGEAAMIVMLFVDRIASSSMVSASKVLKSIFSWFSTQDRFNQFSLGMFSLDDLVFYLTSVCVFVGWIMISVAKRRWNRG